MFATNPASPPNGKQVEPLFNLFFYVVEAGISHGKSRAVALQGRMGGGGKSCFLGRFCCGKF